MDKLFDVWARRNPDWEIRYEDSVIKNFCEYGKGTTSLRDARGKLFGAGYEMFIVAFFIGLYFDQRRKLNPDKSKVKGFGQIIQYWGNVDPNKGRKAYPKLREYIFAALIAKTDFDFIALDKGEKTVREAADALMVTMEEYANWGFHFIEDKLIDNPNYFYAETAFLELFLSFAAEVNTEVDDEPESLEDEVEPLDDGVEKEVNTPAPSNSKTRTRWTTSDIKDLKDFYQSGMKPDKLAKLFNREEQNVIDQLHKLGLL